MRVRALVALVACLSVALASWAPPAASGVGPQPTALVEAATPVYRFYSPTFKGHFYTIDPVERDRVIALWPQDWNYEGERYRAFTTQVAGTQPLYRFWSDRYRGRFYTADLAERDRVIATWPDVWSYEGIAYYVYAAGSGVAGTVPVFRFWGPNVLHHFYTASASERDNVISRWPNVWSYEREKFRVPSEGLVVDPVPTLPADKNCSDFATWAGAQAFFGQYYAYYGDFANLDSDGDLVACEALPGHP